MKVKKLISVCLSASMVFSSFAPAFSAEATSNSAVSKFTDTEGHWAFAAIEKWSDFHVLNGSEGLFRPDGYITRAEMATILDNMMGYQKSSKNSFSDVPSGAWYAAAVLKANAAGILNGDGSGHANPTDKITREQAALMLARAFYVDDNQGGTSKFADQSEISSWAKSQVFGMEAAGYISGYHSKFNPKSSITRAEVITIINNAVKSYYMNPGTYTADSNGLAVIKSDGITLKDAVIDGNLIIAEGVSDGNVTLDGAMVKGSLIARGGGENSIVIKDGSEVRSVKVEKIGGKIRIFADGVVINELEASEEAILEGAFGTVTIAENASVTIKGNVAALNLEKDSIADIQSGTITTLNVPSGATATIADRASIKTANLTGSAEIKGTGKIEVAIISGQGAKIQQTPTKTNLSEGASADVGGKAVGGTPSVSGGSKGSSGGSGSSGTTVYSYESLVSQGKQLRPFTLLGSISNDKMNLRDVTKDAKIYSLYNASNHSFYKSAPASDHSALIGTFVELWDTDNDGKADLILSVPWSQRNNYWDSEMNWLDGVGASTEPEVSDESGRAVFEQEYMIPMGERLLAGYGLGSYSGTTDFSNLEDESYWPFIDFYNATSSDTLTILSGYRSSLQATGGTCGPASVLTVLDWYDERYELNEEDLSSLREPQTRWGGFSSLEAMIGIFRNLEQLEITGIWDIYSSYDDPDALFDPVWIQETLAAGSPIIVGWNSFGAHYQVIIGYDDMGTEGTNDDVLILMDPYDTTDHKNDGYSIQSYERLAWGVGFEEAFDNQTSFLVASPRDWSEKNYSPVMGAGIPENPDNIGTFTDSYKIPYGYAESDLDTYYPSTPYRGENGLAGPAAGGFERSGDHNYSPYYQFYDIYHLQSDTSLVILNEFRTAQQVTEWTCGPTSALMVLDWFDRNDDSLTELDLAQLRQGGRPGATFVDGMAEIFSNLNEDTEDTVGDWIWFTTRDLGAFIDPDNGELEIGGRYLEAGAAEDPENDGLIPYLLKQGIPMMIGWDEWGGHWQVIIGYDDMGTLDNTQDDVLILADPYDTTDHNQDGYVLESFERLVYGWSAAFEDSEYALIVALPFTAEYEHIISELGL